MIDESGTLTAAKLAWNESAWTQLFFADFQSAQGTDTNKIINLVQQSLKDLTVLDTVAPENIEEQILDSRVTLILGWSSKVKRLCIMGVE
jgi:hypothetical protein